jgi:uncharacterized membrane protein YtjA (UPF0391 family)
MGLLTWALIFLILALLAGAIGLPVVATAAAGIAKVLFFIFLAAFVVFLVLGFVYRPRKRVDEPV